MEGYETQNVEVDLKGKANETLTIHLNNLKKVHALHTRLQKLKLLGCESTVNVKLTFSLMCFPHARSEMKTGSTNPI